MEIKVKETTTLNTKLTKANGADLPTSYKAITVVQDSNGKYQVLVLHVEQGKLSKIDADLTDGRIYAKEIFKVTAVKEGILPQ